jgi:hypothetical protein
MPSWLRQRTRTIANTSKTGPNKATGKITGEERYWSRNDLWDFQASGIGILPLRAISLRSSRKCRLCWTRSGRVRGSRPTTSSTERRSRSCRTQRAPSRRAAVQAGRRGRLRIRNLTDDIDSHYDGWSASPTAGARGCAPLTELRRRSRATKEANLADYPSECNRHSVRPRTASRD